MQKENINKFDFYNKINEITTTDYKTNNIERKLLFVYFGYLKQELLEDIIRKKTPTLITCYIYVQNKQYPFTDEIKELIKNHNILLIEKDPQEELNAKMTTILHSLKYRDSQYVIDTECPDFNESYMEKFKEFIKSSIRAFNAMQSFDLMRIKNAIIHLPKILNSNLKVQSKDKNTPAIICAAGPSLVTQMELLKKYQDKVYIIAVGHAIFSLIDAGIKIDFAIEVDPIGGHCSDAAALLTRGDNNPIKKFDFPLVTDISNSTSTTARFDKVIWRLMYQSPFCKYVVNGKIKLKSLLTSSTVTSTALDFATELSDNIALIGCDLSAQTDGTMHAGEKADKTTISNDFKEMIGLDEKVVYSESYWVELGDAIENVIEQIKEKDEEKRIKLYNSTAQGLKIEGLERISLEDFVDNFTNKEKEYKLLPDNLQKSDCEEIQLCIEENVENLKGYLKNLHRILELFTLAKKEKFPVDSPFLLEFKDCLGKENEYKNNKAIGYLTLCVERYIEECQIDTKQKLLLEDFGRYKMLFNFMSDIYNSMRIAANNEKYDENIGAEFYAFREYAIDFIEESNPELAEYLRKNDLKTDKTVYYLSFFQNKPAAVKILHNDEPFSIAQHNNHKQVTAKFVEDNNFNPNNDAVVFFAPGNWSYVLDFTVQYPDTNIIIVEPNLEIFNNVVKLGMFTHRFTEKNIVVGMDDNLRKWKRVYHSAMRNLKREGKRILFFEQPYTWQLPEIQEKLEVLKSLG